MAQDIFIKFSSIEGESQDFHHKEEIDVLRWGWKVRQASNMHSGSGGGAGNAPLTICMLNTILIKPAQPFFSTA